MNPVGPAWFFGVLLGGMWVAIAYEIGEPWWAVYLWVGTAGLGGILWTWLASSR